MPAATTAPDPSQQALAGYVNAGAAVSSYAYALSKTQLQRLNSAPAWYGSFAQELAVAQSHALVWMNGVLPNMQAVPAAIVNFNSLVESNFGTLRSTLGALALDPGNPALLRAIDSAVSTLTGQIQSVQGAVSSFEQSITDFAADLVPDSQTLTRFAKDATQASGADQAAVARLNAAIVNLQQLIAAKNEAATLSRLGKGTLGIFLVVVAATVGWLGGPIVDGILAMGAIGLLAGIGDKLATDSDVQQQVADISNIQQEIQTVDAEIALVQATAAQFAQLATENSTVQQQIQVVENFWTPPLDQLAATLTDLAAVSADSTSQDIAGALNEAQAAFAGWGTLQSFASQLTTVAYNFQPGVTMLPLKVGPPLGMRMPGLYT